MFYNKVFNETNYIFNFGNFWVFIILRRNPKKKKRSINLTQLGYPYAKKYIIILPIIRKTVSIYKKSQQWKKWQWKFFLLLHNQIFQNINNYSNKKKDEKAYLQKVEIIIPRWHALHILQIAGLTDIMFTYVLIIRLLKQKIGLLIEINHPKKKQPSKN